MRVPGFALVLARVLARVSARVVMLVAAVGLSACVPDVVSLEAVPTPKFSHDLAQCNAEANGSFSLGNAVKHCMKAKGYRFLKQY
jgi:hypothetical protein